MAGGSTELKRMKTFTILPRIDLNTQNMKAITEVKLFMTEIIYSFFFSTILSVET